MSERMQARRARHRPSSHVSSFFSRFGIGDPLNLDAPAASKESGFFDLLRRMGQTEARRDHRFSRIFGRDAWTPFRRFGGEKPRLLAPSSLGSFGAGDFLLIRPSTQNPQVQEDPLAEQSVRRVPTRKPRLAGRQPKVKTSRAVRAALTAPPPPKAPRLPTMDVSLPRSGRSRDLTLAQTGAPSAPAPRPVRAKKARAPEMVSALPVLRSLERVAAAVAEPEKAAAVRRLAGELRQMSPKRWNAQIRATLRQIGAEDDVLVAEVESALPDTYVSPVTMAMSRAGDRPERGLKPVTRRSPLVRAALKEDRAAPAQHVRKVRAAAPRRLSTRAARARTQPRAPGARVSASSRASAGADGSEGPEPGPEAPKSLRRALREAGEALVLDPGLELEAELAGETEVEAPVRASRVRREPASVRAVRRAARGSFSGQRWADAATPQPSPAARPTRRARPARAGAPSSRAAQNAAAPLIRRVASRDERSGEIGLRPSFYSRLGLAAPVAPTSTLASPSAAPTTRAEAPRLERLAASRVRRDARERAFEAAHAGPRAEAVRRRWPGEPGARSASIRTLAPTDLLLPRAPEPEVAPEQSSAVPAEKRVSSRVRALAPVLGRESRAATPEIRASARSVARPAARPSRAAAPSAASSSAASSSVALPRAAAAREEEIVSTSPVRAALRGAEREIAAFEAMERPERFFAEQTVAPAAPAPRRAMDRAGERLSGAVVEAPAARTLREAAISAPSPRAVARVVQAIEALSSDAVDSRARAAVVRQALRELGPAGRLVAAEVEAALPAELARPETVAQARVGSTAKAPLGLRPILGRSPALVEIQAPPPVSAPEAAPAATPRAPSAVRAAARVAPARSARLSASPVARAAASVARLSSSPVARSTAARPAAATPVARAASPVAPERAVAPGAREKAARPVDLARSPVEAEILTETAAERPSASRPSARAMARAQEPAPTPTVAAVSETRAARSNGAALRSGRFQARGVATASESTARELSSAVHAVARLDTDTEQRSVLPRVAPTAERALRRSISRALGAFAPEQSLARPTPTTTPESAPSAQTVASPRLAPTRAPQVRVAAERRPELDARAVEPRQERGVEAPAPRPGAFVPVRLLEATFGPAARGEAASRPEGARAGAVLRATTRGESGSEAQRSLLPSVTPRLDRALAPARAGRRTLSLSGEIILPAPARAESPATSESPAPISGVRGVVRAGARSTLTERQGSLTPAVTPRRAQGPVSRARAGIAFAPIAFAPTTLSAQETPRSQGFELDGRGPAVELRGSVERPALGAVARGERAPSAGYTAVRAPHSASARLSPRPRGPLSYARAPEAILAHAPAQSVEAESAAPRALDRTRTRSAAMASRPQGQALARLQQPATAGAGVVRLMSEARAVQEVLTALSRSPARRDARVQRVSASARQLLGDVMADAARSPVASAASRAALSEVHALLSGMTPTEPTATARRVIPGRTRRSSMGAPDLRLPSQVPAQAQTSAPASASAPGAAPRRTRDRLSQIRGLVGGASAAQQTESAPADRLTRARRSRLEPRQRLSARTPTAESILFARPEGAGTPASGGGGGGGGGGGARRGGLNETLGAVGTGELGPDLPSWANRSVGQTRVRGTVGGLMDALARAKSPTEVVRAVERRDAAVRNNRTLPAPVLRLIDEIRSEAAAEAEASAAEYAAAMGLPTPAAPGRRGNPRQATSSQVFRGFTNLGQTKRTQGQDGLGADRLMKLVRKLQQLVFLADSQRDAAMRQVRLAEDSASARAEGQAAPTQSGDSKSQQVDVEALAQEVMQHVQRELESRSERRQDDPDNRSPWW